MAQCQPDTSYIVLGLLMSDGKSRPGQPSVRKHSRHHGCWQQHGMEQNQAAQTCAKGQLGTNWTRNQMFQGSVQSLLCSSKSVCYGPQGCSQKLNSKSSVQCTSLPRILAFSFYVVPFFPRLQTPVSLGVIFNSCSCLYYTTHTPEQEVTSFPMHW